MSLWHPLKLTGLCYATVDLCLMSGGVAYANNWILGGGVIGMLGNIALLLGGSGRQHVTSSALRRMAPYAERLAMYLYGIQNITFIVSGLTGYDHVMYGEIACGSIGLLGNVIGLCWPQNARLGSYQLIGTIWTLNSILVSIAGFESGNLGVLISGFFGVLGNLFVTVSRRAEFSD